ncbi:MAG: hypothetical protein QXL47_02780 [Candidatus Anstonellales archaeon]
MPVCWGKGEGKLVERALDWKIKYKERVEAAEKLEKAQRFQFKGWVKKFFLSALGIVAAGVVYSSGIGMIYFLTKPDYSYEQLKENEREKRINAIVEQAKILRKDDRNLSTDELHKKYVFTFTNKGNVVHKMPADYRAVSFIFGEEIAKSIIAWSNYFEIDPAIVVAILCAENGSSTDANILNNVGLRFSKNPHLADKTVSRSGAMGIAQIKPSTAEITIKKLLEEGRWPFKTTDVYVVLSDYDMSIFLLCALIHEIKKSGYGDIKDIAGIYHSGHNGWSRKKAEGENNNDEVWKEIKKAQLAKQEYEGVRAYLSKPSQNE